VDATLFIVASSVLSVFNVTKAKGENGHEIPVRAAISARNGLVAYVLIVVPKHLSELIGEV